jgi:medium-chain acyl-[acyl-carrier-protein] hydrolase
MPDDVEVCAVRLPGRENLRAEPFAPDFESLADKAADILEPYSDLPYAAFGHSMGSWLAFEAGRRLRRRRGREPLALFVSGRRAPHIAGHQTPIHDLPQAEFIAEIQRRYNGIPAVVLTEPELLALTLPVLRADLAVLTSYEYDAQAPLGCPLYCYSGEEDHEISADELRAWREHTADRFEVRRFAGDHFYLTGPSGVALRADIAARLSSLGTT